MRSPAHGEPGLPGDGGGAHSTTFPVAVNLRIPKGNCLAVSGTLVCSCSFGRAVNFSKLTRHHQLKWAVLFRNRLAILLRHLTLGIHYRRNAATDSRYYTTSILQLFTDRNHVDSYL